VTAPVFGVRAPSLRGAHKAARLPASDQLRGARSTVSLTGCSSTKASGAFLEVEIVSLAEPGE